MTPLITLLLVGGQTPAVQNPQQQQAPPPVSDQRPTPPIQPNLTVVPLPPAVTLGNFPPGVPQPVTAPISAEEAAKVALQRQPTLGLSQAAVLAAQGKTLQERSLLGPNVALTSSYTNRQNLHGQFFNGQPGFDTSIVANQLIFDFNHTLDLVRQAEAQEQSAKHAYTRAQNDLVLATKNAYYTYAQDLALIKVQEANLASDQASLALAQAQLSAGIGEPVNVVTAQTNVATATLALSQARSTALTARIALAVEMGVDARTPLMLSESTEPTPQGDDVNAFVDTALKNRPEIRQYKEDLRAAGYEVSSARTTNAPSVGLAVTGGSQGDNTPFNDQGLSAAITVNWTLFDSGRQAGLVKQSQADVLTAKANLTTFSQTIVQDVAQAYVNLRTAEQEVQIAKSAVANGQEAVRIAEGRFRAGIGTFIDVTTAQATLVQAQTQQVTAESQVQQSRAALRHAMGLI